MDALKAALPGLRVTSSRSLFACGTRYIVLGWSGYVPEACRNTLVLVPSTYAWLLWGWPLRFQQRIEAYGSELAVVQRVNGMTGGFDAVDDLQRLPPDFSGSIWTNRVELVAPALPVAPSP
jgi:glycerophosphoryl diester phosphodiesterase